MWRYRRTISGFFFLLLLTGCLVIDNQFTGLPPGPWRAVLKLNSVPVTPNPKAEPLPEKVNLKFEEVSAGELPFVFEVIYDGPEEFHIELINGEERILVEDITMGLDRKTAKDTIIINFPVFDSYIKAIFEENVMEGEWVVSNRENYRIPFVAYHGQDHRFTKLRKEPIIDISGRWEVLFGLDPDEAPYPAIGDFQQDGNHLTGTFITETGDYRYLEGTIQSNKIYLSTFDGSHAFLFEAKITDDNSMIGSFLSGSHYKTLWEARRNPEATLQDPMDFTKLLAGYERLSFSFENPDGEQISLDDERYEGKVKIIEIFGTWCPNCRDATNFLVDFVDQNEHPDLSVIGLAFEKYRDKEKSMQALRTYQKKLDIPYELLLAGYHEKDEAQKALPMLDSLYAFPTLILLNRKNEVEMIQTGFSGPATEEYKIFKTNFQAYINDMLVTSNNMQ